jgi:hypothetical protein
MWWKLGALGVVTVLALFLLLAPMMTVTVRVDLPPGSARVGAGQIQTDAGMTLWVIEAILVASVLAIATLIGWRIVRRDRISN